MVFIWEEAWKEIVMRNRIAGKHFCLSMFSLRFLPLGSKHPVLCEMPWEEQSLAFLTCFSFGSFGEEKSRWSCPASCFYHWNTLMNASRFRGQNTRPVDTNGNLVIIFKKGQDFMAWFSVHTCFEGTIQICTVARIKHSIVILLF